MAKKVQEEIILGGTYKDVITGFTGVATGLCFYLTGCNQVLLASKISEPKWFDVQRCKRVGKSLIILNNSSTPGFDLPAPIR